MDGKTVIQPLTFKSVKGRFRLLEVQFVEYTDGSGFFAVSRPHVPQPFPYAPSLRCFVAKHADDESIPTAVIENWMVQLGCTAQEIGTFWAVQDFETGFRQGTLEF